MQTLNQKRKGKSSKTVSFTKANGKATSFMVLAHSSIPTIVFTKAISMKVYKKDLGSKHGIWPKGFSNTKGFGNKAKWKERENSYSPMEKNTWEK